MNIRNIFLSICACAAVLLATSCETISEDERMTYVKPTDVKKHVLIEDFTGQLCRNCPEATATIHELQQQYGEDAVVAVGLYSGPFGKRTSGAYLSLTTATGDYYYQQRGISQQPSMMLDRKLIISDNSVLTARVNEYLGNEARAIMQLTSDYDSVSAKTIISVAVEGIETSTDARLQVWLMEDSITDAQIMPTGKTNKEYVHNHVFRTTVTDKDGVQIDVEQGQKVSEIFEATIDTTAWKPENMSVVAFVFDSNGVLQVLKTPLIEKNEGETTE